MEHGATTGGPSLQGLGVGLERAWRCYIVVELRAGGRSFSIGVVRYGGLAGRCVDKSGAIGTMGGVSIYFRGNRFYTIAKPDNSNGSAFVRVLSDLRCPASNRIVCSKGSLNGFSSSRLSVLHHEEFNFIFRSCGLIRRLAKCRGVLLPMVLSGGGPSRRCLGSVVGALKVSGEVSRLPSTVDNNRRREVTVTHTLTGGPSVLFTSRPANGLSNGDNERILSLLDRATSGCNAALVLIARSLRITRRTREILAVRSNVVISSDGKVTTPIIGTSITRI